MSKSAKSVRGKLYAGASPENIVARLRRELELEQADNKRLTSRLRQFEQHRNRPLLRNLEANLDALEAIGIDGWPKNDEGRSSNRSTGSRGDKAAITCLVFAEELIAELNFQLAAWMELREEKPQLVNWLDTRHLRRICYHHPVGTPRPEPKIIPDKAAV